MGANATIGGGEGSGEYSLVKLKSRPKDRFFNFLIFINA